MNIWPYQGAPTSGSSGTLYNDPRLRQGDLLVDTDNAALYVQSSGTPTSPTWIKFQALNSSGNTPITGNFTVAGTTALTGNATAAGTLGVTGAITGTSLTLSTTLAITGALTGTSASFSTTLGVTGALTGSSGSFSTTLSATGNLTAGAKVIVTPQTVQDIATGNTVAVAGSKVRLTATVGAATGVGLAAGTVDGQELTIYNVHATNLIAFTTNLATAFSLLGLTSSRLTWDATTSKWY